MEEVWKKQYKYEEEKGDIGHGKTRRKKQRSPLIPDPRFLHSIYHFLAYGVIYSLCSHLPPKEWKLYEGRYFLSILCTDAGMRPEQYVVYSRCRVHLLNE